MNRYYIDIRTYCTPQPHIIDEATLDQAERGGNYLNPDDFMLLCEAASMADAIKCHAQEYGQLLVEVMFDA